MVFAKTLPGVLLRGGHGSHVISVDIGDVLFIAGLSIFSGSEDFSMP